MKRLSTASVFALLTTLSSSVMAAQDITVDLQVFAVNTDPQGRDVLKPAKQASPGDILLYQITCKNNTASLVKDVSTTLPIPPKELLFLKGQSGPHDMQASIDGQQFSAPPLKKLSTSPDGRIIATLVEPKDYRFLRWNVGDIPAHGVVQVHARMRVLSETKLTQEVAP